MSKLSHPGRVMALFPAAGGVILLSLLYVGLMLAWVAAREPLRAPGFILEEPLREFFVTSMIVAAAGGASASVILRAALRRSEVWRRIAMASGLLMVATGLVGMLIIVPATSSLSSSGGLNPDFGHLLTWDNFTGALWLFLLTGAIPYSVAFFADPGRKSLAGVIGLIATTAPGLWYIAMAVIDRWEHINAP